MAVLRALANPPGWPTNAPLVYAVGALSALQVGAVLSQAPPQFAKGGLLDGPLHGQGGMPIINPRTGAKVAEIEGGEAILSRNTVANNWPLVSALLNSSMNMNGASVMRSVTAPPRFDMGGVIRSSVPNPSAQSDNTSRSDAVYSEMDATLKNIQKLLEKLDRSMPLKAYMVMGDRVIYELRDEMRKNQRATDDQAFR